MSDDLTFDPTNPSWPNSYQAMLERASKLLDAIDAGHLTFEPAVDRSGALREVSLVPRPHSTVPTETPRTGPLSALQEALADCPGLSPEEMREMHPECFEEDAQHMLTIDPDFSSEALVLEKIEHGRPVWKNNLASPSGGVDRVSPGLETCPGCGQPMSYHDDEGFVL